MSFVEIYFRILNWNTRMMILLDLATDFQIFPVNISISSQIYFSVELFSHTSTFKTATRDPCSLRGCIPLLITPIVYGEGLTSLRTVVRYLLVWEWPIIGHWKRLFWKKPNPLTQLDNMDPRKTTFWPKSPENPEISESFGQYIFYQVLSVSKKLSGDLV
jgi:hypothetical protein